MTAAPAGHGPPSYVTAPWLRGAAPRVPPWCRPGTRLAKPVRIPTTVAAALAIGGLALGWLVDPTFYGLVALVGTDLFLPGWIEASSTPALLANLSPDDARMICARGDLG